MVTEASTRNFKTLLAGLIADALDRNMSRQEIANTLRDFACDIEHAQRLVDNANRSETVP
jgi:hypothetical protein